MTSPKPLPRSRRIVDFVVAHPGAAAGDVTDHICHQERLARSGRTRMVNLVCIQLSNLLEAGKVRRTGQPMHYRYWPTKLSQLDLRSHDRNGNPKPRKRPAKAPAKISRKPSSTTKRTPDVQATPKAAQVERDASPMASKPKPASQVQVVDRTRKAAQRTNGVHRETVEQFLARGGRIQRVGPNDAAQPLRFDHSQAQVPPKRRAPLRRRNANAS